MHSKAPALALICSALLAAACSEPAGSPVAPAEMLPSSTVKPGGPGAAADRMLYKVRLASENDTHSRGVVLIEIVGGHIAVTAHAAGVAPSSHIPQHIHLNPTCNPGGGILLNLDANLTVAGEGPGVGTAYPVSSAAGVLKYHATRSLDDLRAAINTHAGANLDSDQELLAWLDLENRNAHMHVAVGPPFPAVNCGEVVRLN